MSRLPAASLTVATTAKSTSLAAPGRVLEKLVHVLLLLCAVFSICTTLGIVGVLLSQSLPFFREVSIIDYLTGTNWSPNQGRFGVLPLVCGTCMVAGGSAIFAIPLGLGTAVYLSEYATPLARDIIKPVLEILAGIPSVVYGYLAVIYISPIVREIFPSAELFNSLNASIVVGIMILPMIVSLSEDVLRSVPRSLREAGYALGAHKLDVTVGIVLPAAMSGIMASFLLAIARAVGETMAVVLACGAMKRLTFNPLESVQTMTAYIVEISQGDIPQGSLEHRTIFAVGLTLFVSTLLLNIVAQWILSRVREKYE